MITKTEIKLFKSLSDKKARAEHGLFLVEGIKSVQEVMKSRFEVHKILYSKTVKAQFEHTYKIAFEVDERTIEQISSFSTPQQVIAVCYSDVTIANYSLIEDSVHLYLASIRDPGNLGTIIRLADWFGMEQIFCSEDTVDFFNPKVIQATMGSFCRINVVYESLAACIEKVPKHSPIYASSLSGSSLNANPLSDKGLLIIGNEANGLSPEEEMLATHRLRIPGPFKDNGPESLNAAMATSILLSAFKKII
jgi:RNA methyltransferase, TrmH family